MTVKAVFFDLGGTLMVMRRDKMIRQVLLDRGKDVDIETIHASYLSVETWWLSKYGNRYLTQKETEEAYAILNEKIFEDLYASEGRGIYEGALQRWRELDAATPYELYADSEPLLRRLKSKDLLLGLISNAPATSTKAVQRLGLDRYLSRVVISGVVGYTKPHPKIFELALDGTGINTSEAVHVGDLYDADVVGARSAGMEGVLLDRDGSQKAPDCVKIRGLAELDGVLRTLNGTR